MGELSSLVRSIKEVGLLHPIVVSEKNELIAGFRRIKAFQLLGKIEIPCNRISLSDLRKGEIQENMIRKDFTVSEMVAVKRALEPEVKIGQGKRRDLTCEESSHVKTREIVAEFANTSFRHCLSYE